MTETTWLDKLLHLFTHRWEIIYSDNPRFVRQCIVCDKKMSTMYDMAYGGTYWVNGDHWSYLKKLNDPWSLPKPPTIITRPPK